MCRWSARRYLTVVKIGVRKAATRRRILGIDPGTNLLGFAVIEELGGKRSLIHFGAHRTPARGSHPEKLRSIFDCIVELVDLFKPAECAIESPFFGKNVQSMLKLGRAQGVAMAAAISRGIPVSEYAPKKIKLSVTGSGNASKEQVADMLCATLNFEREGMTLDATDAVGVAYTHLNQSAFGAASGESYAGWKNFLERNPNRLG